jgi:hypothetical protein
MLTRREVYIELYRVDSRDEWTHCSHSKRISRRWLGDEVMALLKTEETGFRFLVEGRCIWLLCGIIKSIPLCLDVFIQQQQQQQ